MEVHLEEDERDQWLKALEVSLNSNNSTGYLQASGDCSGFGGTYIGTGSAVGIQPLTGVSDSTELQIIDHTNWKIEICKDFHVVTEELLSCSDDENIVAVCDRCGVRIFIPRIPGAFSFEKAGNVLGRAMSLNDDDNDAVAELVIEIEALQTAVDKDIRKYKRAMEVLEIARGIARKQLVKAVSEPV